MVWFSNLYHTKMTILLDHALTQLLLPSLFRIKSFINDPVVSTVESGILFAHFRRVDLVTNKSGFLFMTSKLIKKVPVEKESSLSIGGAIIFLTLFPQNYRMLDATVETTDP